VFKLKTSISPTKYRKKNWHRLHLWCFFV
jgi:hypothetical protein